MSYLDRADGRQEAYSKALDMFRSMTGRFSKARILAALVALADSDKEWQETGVKPIPPTPGPNATLQEKAEWRDAIGR